MSDVDANVLLLLTDQWRHDAVGYRAGSQALTPTLDGLAKGGVAFEHAFTPIPLCSPARACLLTGRWPFQSAMIDNVGVGASKQGPLEPGHRTWLDAAVQSGYRVGYYGKWHLGADGPIARGVHGHSPSGFERNAPPPGSGKAPVTERGELEVDQDRVHPRRDLLPGSRPPYYGTLTSGIEDTQTRRTASEAIGFFEQDDGRPWFLTTSFHGPHFPHLVPEPFAGLVAPGAADLPGSLDDSFTGKPWFQSRPWWPCHDTSGLTQDDWRKTTAAYLGMIAFIDAEMGRVLNAATASSGGRPTVVIFTSDHGEMLGAHGRFDKGPYLYDEVMRVPLLIRRLAPGETALDIGPEWRQEFVSLLDVAETLFGLAGEQSHGPGRDLLHLTAGRSNDAWPDEAIGWYQSYNGHSFTLRSIRTLDYKYCFNPQDVDELYDLKEDRGEVHNLIGDCAHKAIGENLRERLMVWMRRAGDPLAEGWDDLPDAGTLN